MVVRIRLARFGQKNSPFYRIVVADSRFRRDGRFIERVSIQIATLNIFVYCFLRSYLSLQQNLCISSYCISYSTVVIVLVLPLFTRQCSVNVVLQLIVHPLINSFVFNLISMSVLLIFYCYGSIFSTVHY